MLNSEERAIVEELTGKYLVSTEVVAHLIQYRRHLPSQPEKVRVLPHFLDLMKEIAVVRKAETRRLQDNRILDEERKREARTVGSEIG